jgi:hypothetical protein
VAESCSFVPRFLIQHHHDPGECGVVYRSFSGSGSPLRHHSTLASCAFGGHAIWWSVQARDEADALALLPYFVAARASATRVEKVDIP